MAISKKIKIVSVIWLLIFAGTIFWRFVAPTEAVSFEQNMDRAVAFMFGQVIAGSLAFYARSLALRLPRDDRMRLVGQLPVIVMALIISAFLITGMFTTGNG